jgi:hypothetical protein
MQMSHASIKTLAPAAANVATAPSCRREPFGAVRPDENHALARRCSR